LRLIKNDGEKIEDMNNFRMPLTRKSRLMIKVNIQVLIKALYAGRGGFRRQHTTYINNFCVIHK